MSSSTEPPLQAPMEKASPEDFAEKFPRLKSLGKGAYGSVHLASDAQMDNKVAIKVINKKKTSLSAFKRELDSSLRVSPHRHVIRTHKPAWDIGDSYVIIQEFADQGNLFQSVLSGNGFDVLTATTYLRQICLALDHVHSLGFVHSDVNLRNIVLTSEGTGPEKKVVKIIDFGNSVPNGHQHRHAPRINGGQRLYRYLAPERFTLPQVSCARCPSFGCTQFAVTPDIDVWAAGIVFYMMLTQKFPWGDASSCDSTFRDWDRQQRSEQASSFWKELVPPCNEILAKLLITNPSKRPSAHDVIVFLEESAWRNRYPGPLDGTASCNWNRYRRSSLHSLLQ